jgi:hypothetical protein
MDSKNYETKLAQIVDQNFIESTWDNLASDFLSPQYKVLTVGNVEFYAFLLPRVVEPEFRIYIETGLSFLAWPRSVGFRYRFVLIPRQSLTEYINWQIQPEDIFDWVIWSNCMNYVTTVSTFKSGAGVPFKKHAQSIPALFDREIYLSSLANLPKELLIDYGQMPFFKEIKISRIKDFPVEGLCIESLNSINGLNQVANKVFELALNYDELKAFNLIILPANQFETKLFFFPRRKDGVATYGASRWQIAGLELNGLLLTKTKNTFDKLNEILVREMFNKTCPSSNEFDLFLKLVDTF